MATRRRMVSPSDNDKGRAEAPKAARVKSNRIVVGGRAGDGVLAARSVKRDVLLG